ncbi:MAG TPA: T9SS type A sorting domain-containing protein [Ferruginibacter sp.]|nr:T9SS type A sorting domain-containing protein [Ferruginibacter sp.]HMP22087.1 T9SS type A sorting domain-containing protein [Ferruginibacter sp.]
MKKKFYLHIKKLRAVLPVLALLAPVVLTAQSRNYGIIYSDNIRGGATIFGNTLMHIVNGDGNIDVNAMNDNTANGNSNFSNGNVNMQFVDIDGNTGEGAGTRNSSSSDLVLPSGTNTIKMARLYWGGRAFTADVNMNNPANRTIKIRKGNSGPYTELGALQVDRIYQNQGTANEVTFYQAYVDVTDFLQQNGDGTYTVGNAAMTRGDGGTFGNYGGWSIVVVYENETLDFNSIRVYDGYQQVFNGGSPTISTVTLTGLDVPSGVLSSTDARMGTMVWEGDANFTGDFLEINGTRYSDAVNQSNNTWNGTIANDGVHVTTKNPNYTNQMGVDIDQFNVGTGYGILPNATSVTLRFGTELDSYFPSVFTFVIKMKTPVIDLSKFVSDTDQNGTAEAGEVLTYKLTGKNLGLGNATDVLITDTLPANVTYVPGSLKVISAPGATAGSLTDAAGDDIGEYIVNGSIKAIHIRVGTGADATAGGTLAPQDEFEFEFQVTVNEPAPGESILPIINIARMTAQSESHETYVDDGVAIINPVGGPLPVTLKSFAASLLGTSTVRLNWTTSMEINSKYYDIERSFDGRTFTKVAVVEGAGNTTNESRYNITEDITALNASTIYYRLKQVDYDGQFSYSKVIALRLKKSAGSLTVSPNPFNGYVNINIDWDKNERTAVKVFNMNGTELVYKTVQLAKGTNNIQLDELYKLPAGNYILQFNNGSERVYKQITKQ